MICPNCQVELIGFDEVYKKRYNCPMCGCSIKSMKDVNDVIARKQKIKYVKKD